MNKLIITDAKKLIEYIKKQGAQRIFIQSPNGFRSKLIYLADKIEREIKEIEIIIDGNLNYGGCDIQGNVFSLLDLDIVIHVGHTPFQHNIIKPENVIYYPLFENKKITKKLYLEIYKLAKQYNNIGVVNSLQYYKQSLELVNQLQGDGFQVFIEKPVYNYMFKGQILGCDISAAHKIKDKIDVFFVVSSGVFHALGVALWINKPTFVVDIHNERIIDLEKLRRKYLSKIAYNIEKTRECLKIGVIISPKSGQFNYMSARFAYDELKKLRKKVYLISMENITQEQLSYFLNIEAFIQTACPRLSIDDIFAFEKPVLNMEQFLILIGKKKFEEVYP